MESDKTKIEFGSASSAPRLDYNINLATGGSYYVWVRGIGFDGNSDSVHLGVNGVPQISAGNIAIRREGVIWSRFSTEIGASATLFFNAGAQTISLFMRESGTSVDAIKLTTDKAYRPDQAASIPTISIAPNTPSSGTITEGSDDGITYTFARSTAFGDLPVAVSLFSGTAIADDYIVSGQNVDYDAATGSFVVTFKGTETQASFTVKAKSDAIVEGDETLTLAIDESSGDSYRVAAGTETTTAIKDLPVVSVEATVPNAEEEPGETSDDNIGILTFSRAGEGICDWEDDLTIYYRIDLSNLASALPGGDYEDFYGYMANYDCYQATIPAGLESVSVVVRPFDDDVIENIELLEIELLPDVMATSTVPARYVVAANPSVSSSLFIGPIELSQMQLTAADPAKAVVTLNDTEVAKVEWVGTDGGDGKSNLEATEENGGGFRLFPDKNSPGEAGKTHRKFKAKITLSAPIPDETLKTVYVKIFDVDDPTESASDTNDSANGTIQRGNDNVGANGGLVSSEMVEIKVTPGQTSVEVEYTLSDVSPGNNFKVFATTHAALANDVEIDTAVGNGLSRENAFRKASDHSVKPDPKDSTSLLSIWRRLNVEIDRMGGIVRDHASSTFPLEADLVDALNRLTTDGGENRTLVTIGGDRPMESWQRDAFTGGNLIIDDIAYPILLSTDQHFGVKGHVPDTAIGKEWIAYDDDATTFPGVDAGQVPWPDIGALNKAFNKAYIQVEVVESAKSADTTFRSNVEKTAYEEVIREKKTLVTEDDYWTITALGAFQGPKLADGDGLDDNATLLFGFAPALKEDDFTGLNGIIMFAETLRDVAAQMTYATEDAHAAALKSMSERWVVHEVAHAFGLRHESGGIMAYLQSTPEAWSEATGMQMVFSRQQLEQLRSSDAMERIGSDSK